MSTINKDAIDKDIPEVKTYRSPNTEPVILEGSSSINLIDKQSTASIEADKTITIENDKRYDGCWW